ncbi:MAG TPA: Lrp/AsnC family transcriptional regulator [Candidatus Aminicenantes bacterium]|nr:Lrp/AsnC family transcriptional regulator [Candidatus Aminicenantes bacterium]
MIYDEYDKGILRILYEDGKVSNAALARRISLSPPATLERVRKLRTNGVIRGQRAVLDKTKLGRGLTCFLALQIKHLRRREDYRRVEAQLKQLEEIEEIYFLTGRIDYLIKVNIRDIDEFREFFMAKLSKVPMIERAETFVAVSSAVNPRYDPINVDTARGPSEGPRQGGWMRIGAKTRSPRARPAAARTGRSERGNGASDHTEGRKIE